MEFGKFIEGDIRMKKFLLTVGFVAAICGKGFASEGEALGSSYEQADYNGAFSRVPATTQTAINNLIKQKQPSYTKDQIASVCDIYSGRGFTAWATNTLEQLSSTSFSSHPLTAGAGAFSGAGFDVPAESPFKAVLDALNGLLPDLEGMVRGYEDTVKKGASHKAGLEEALKAQQERIRQETEKKTKLSGEVTDLEAEIDAAKDALVLSTESLKAKTSDASLETYDEKSSRLREVLASFATKDAALEKLRKEINDLQTKEADLSDQISKINPTEDADALAFGQSILTALEPVGNLRDATDSVDGILGALRALTGDGSEKQNALVDMIATVISALETIEKEQANAASAAKALETQLTTLRTEVDTADLATGLADLRTQIAGADAGSIGGIITAIQKIGTDRDALLTRANDTDLDDVDGIADIRTTLNAIDVDAVLEAANQKETALAAAAKSTAAITAITEGLAPYTGEAINGYDIETAQTALATVTGLREHLPNVADDARQDQSNAIDAKAAAIQTRIGTLKTEASDTAVAAINPTILNQETINALGTVEEARDALAALNEAVSAHMDAVLDAAREALNERIDEATRLLEEKIASFPTPGRGEDGEGGVEESKGDEGEDHHSVHSGHSEADADTEVATAKTTLDEALKSSGALKNARAILKEKFSLAEEGGDLRGAIIAALSDDQAVALAGIAEIVDATARGEALTKFASTLTAGGESDSEDEDHDDGDAFVVPATDLKWINSISAGAHAAQINELKGSLELGSNEDLANAIANEENARTALIRTALTNFRSNSSVTINPGNGKISDEAGAINYATFVETLASFLIDEEE
jgi:hypothetical protein